MTTTSIHPGVRLIHEDGYVTEVRGRLPNGWMTTLGRISDDTLAAGHWRVFDRAAQTAAWAAAPAVEVEPDGR